ncbi:MAG: HAD-IIIA family hydrolase [Acidobacteria bacterium]|nr:HAD-IIIA family hydrolase [Acidobacteriota bacterium]
MDFRAADVSGFEVAILAGGRGTRLRARTGPLPKPMVPIAGSPALEHQIALCRHHGFTRILLLVHYGHDVIRARVGDGTAHGVTIGYAVDATPRGTAGALRDALPHLADTFLVLYGDTYVDVHLRRLWDAHVARAAEATLFVHPNDHPHDSDLVEIDEAGRVTAVRPAPHPEGDEAANLGVAALFVLERRALLEVVPAGASSDLVKHALPALLDRGARVAAYVSPEYIKDFGTPERLDQVERDIRTGVPERLSGRALRPAVFLDRDGTLNEEVQHLSAPEQVALVPGAAAAVRRLNHAGCLAVVITNQAVVARGAVTREGLDRIHRRLTHLLGRSGAYLDAIYVCPHHPDRGFPGEVPELKVDCGCRKPRPGLIDAACGDLLVDRRASWLVGDTTADIETGRRAGLRTVLVRTGHAGQDGKYPFRPDYVAVDLGAAVAWILDGHPGLSRRMVPVALASLEARVVAIGGLARSGKSSAAQVLKELVTACGRTVHVLALDSWLKPQGERAEGTGVTSRFDIQRLLAELGPVLQSGERHALDVPVYDRARRCMYGHRVPVSIGPDDLVVLEGVPALVADDLALLADVKVHIDMPEPQRLAHLQADYRWRGESGAAVEALVASRAVDETGPVQAARARADFVVPAWTIA